MVLHPNNSTRSSPYTGPQVLHCVPFITFLTMYLNSFPPLTLSLLLGSLPFLRWPKNNGPQKQTPPWL